MNEIGQLGEDLAVGFLSERGFSIVARNWVAGLGRNCVGEIDVVALLGDTLHIVEVKSRRNSCCDGDFAPQAAFSTAKIKRLSRAATSFVACNGFRGEIVIDLVTVNILPDGSSDIRYFEDLVH